MDKFAGLKAFISVVEAGSFAAAARVIGLSRSQTNKLVIALEEELGVQLFSRSTRHVAPTGEGRAFYAHARQILEDLREAETMLSATQKEAVGQMRVCTPLSLGSLNFSEMVIAFMRRHPALKVDLVQNTRLVDPIAEGFDCVIRIAAPDEETLLVDHRITPVEYMTCAAADYIEKQGAPTHPDELQTHALLHYSGSEKVRYWQYTGPGGTVTVPIKPIFTANNLEAIREAVCGGLGIAILPRYAVQQDLASGRLVGLLTEYSLPSYMLQLIYPPSRHLSAKVQLFTAFLIKFFADGLRGADDLSGSRSA